MIQKLSTLQKVVQQFANRPVQINHGFVQRRGVGEGMGDNDNVANENRGDDRRQTYEALLSKLWEEYE